MARLHGRAVGSARSPPLGTFFTADQISAIAHRAIAPLWSVCCAPGRRDGWWLQSRRPVLSGLNVCFAAHNGLKSDIAPCLKSANERHRLYRIIAQRAGSI